jgi:hypothetical protein
MKNERSFFHCSRKSGVPGLNVAILPYFKVQTVIHSQLTNLTNNQPTLSKILTVTTVSMKLVNPLLWLGRQKYSYLHRFNLYLSYPHY